MKHSLAALIVGLEFGLLSVPSFALPAFPGAEGFGAISAGGRGGRVIEVTTLEDSGDGSFRAALEARGPRTVVFRVGGTIELKTELVLTEPYITIAGQTAPGGGITLKTHPANVRSALTISGGCHDVIIRHLRSRPGPHQGFPPRKGKQETDTSEVKDALQILSAQRVIVDHCSFSWATDEVVSTFFDAKDITIQWCIIAEALRKSRPDQALPGKGLLIGSKGSNRVSVHHNLMAHNIGRNPLVKTTGIVDVVNNLAFVPDKVAMAISAEYGGSSANFVNNHVIAPSGEGKVFGVVAINDGTHSLYVSGNLGPHRPGSRLPDDLFIQPDNGGRRWQTSARHDAAQVTTSDAVLVQDQVLKNAGCTVPRRDAVDERILEDVRQQRVRLVNTPSDVGGWPPLEAGTPPDDKDHDGMPDAWESAHGLVPADAADGAKDRDGDGYTNLEEYLNALAQ